MKLFPRYVAAAARGRAQHADRQSGRDSVICLGAIRPSAPVVGVLMEDRIETFPHAVFRAAARSESCNDPSQQVLRTLRVPNNPDFSSFPANAQE
jgi:hypothetical protein